MVTCLQNRIVITHPAFNGSQGEEHQMDFHSVLSAPHWIFLTLATVTQWERLSVPEKRLSNKEPSEMITHQNSNYLSRLPPNVSSPLEAACCSPRALDSGPAAKTLR